MTPETEASADVNLDTVLRQVRKLIERATHDGTDPNEADACRRMADALMLKYAIDEMALDKSRPAEQRQKPGILTVTVGPHNEASGHVAWLLEKLALHCRCQIRMYTKYTYSEGWQCKVYGFESDLRYFEMMYTTVRLHMLGILLPRIDRAQNLEDNAYRLHNAGYNWLQIAEMYGWMKYRPGYRGEYDGTLPPNDIANKTPYWHKEEGWKSASQVGSNVKRAYHRECARRGEKVQVIAANGTKTYRQSAADGYITIIGQRLRDLQKQQASGTALILASRVDDIAALFKEDNPDLFEEKVLTIDEVAPSTQGRRRVRAFKARPVNADAWSRGAEHGRTADLSGNARAGTGRAGELGS
jgi:hypothetical protein